jgi:hypothetical protein
MTILFVDYGYFVCRRHRFRMWPLPAHKKGFGSQGDCRSLSLGRYAGSSDSMGPETSQAIPARRCRHSTAVCAPVRYDGRHRLRPGLAHEPNSHASQNDGDDWQDDPKPNEPSAKVCHPFPAPKCGKDTTLHLKAVDSLVMLCSNSFGDGFVCKRTAVS